MTARAFVLTALFCIMFGATVAIAFLLAVADMPYTEPDAIAAEQITQLNILIGEWEQAWEAGRK